MGNSGTCYGCGADISRCDCEDVTKLLAERDRLRGKVAELTSRLAKSFDSPAGQTLWKECDRLRDEVERLKTAIADGHEGTTHWEDCYKARGHHACAVARVEELEAILRTVPVEFEPEDGDEAASKEKPDE